MLQKIPRESLIHFGLIAILLGLVGYLIYQNSIHRQSIVELEDARATLTQRNNGLVNQLATANTTNAELEDELADIKEDLENLADNYRDEQNRNEEFEDQIRDLAGTLSDLDRLNQIDEELLAKYSRVAFLNENYVPSKLKKIPNRYILEGREEQYFHGEAYEHLEDMLRAAARDDIDLRVISAYRSFDTQTQLKSQFTQIYGEGANQFSADQGFSEHQLGTAVDLTIDAVGGTYTSFAQTEAYEWMLKNAWRYGFILSYPENNDFYIFEPWHWRFVSRDLARHLNRSDETFYTMEQRDIDEYRLEFFD